MTDQDSVAEIDFSDLLRPPQTLKRFVHCVTAGIPPAGASRVGTEEGERRMQARYGLPLQVDVQPITKDFAPAGDVYSVMAHNISVNGIGIRDTRKVTAKFLALQITSPSGERLQVLAEVNRCDAVGRIYEIGAEFVSYGSVTH